MSLYTQIGTINVFATTFVPEGWELCDGTVLNVADFPQYAEAFAHLGSTYGGDGTTTVGLPTIAQIASNLEYFICMKGTRLILTSTAVP